MQQKLCTTKKIKVEIKQVALATQRIKRNLTGYLPLNLGNYGKELFGETS